MAATAAFAAEPAPQVVYHWPSGAATLQAAGGNEIMNPPQPPPGQVIRQVKNIQEWLADIGMLNKSR